MQCINSVIQTAVNNIFLSCCKLILTWIECFIFSLVFVAVAMYNLPVILN